MSPAVPSKHRYSESPDHVPSPIAMRGTLDTSGVGTRSYDYDAVVPVFEQAREREQHSPRIDGNQVAAQIANAPEPVVGSAGADATVVDGSVPDTTGTSGEPAQTPVVEPGGEPGETTSDTTQGPGTDSAETQGTVDTTETDSAQVPAQGEGEGEGAEQYADDPEFTPVGRTVDAVNEYLATASPDEQKRVLAIEAENRNRTGIMEGPHAD